MAFTVIVKNKDCTVEQNTAQCWTRVKKPNTETLGTGRWKKAGGEDHRCYLRVTFLLIVLQEVQLYNKES